MEKIPAKTFYAHYDFLLLLIECTFYCWTSGKMAIKEYSYYILFLNLSSLEDYLFVFELCLSSVHNKNYL